MAGGSKAPVSKKGFFDLLKGKTSDSKEEKESSAAEKKGASGWSVLDDGFGMEHAKMRRWDNAERAGRDGSESGDASGGSESDDASSDE